MMYRLCKDCKYLQKSIKDPNQSWCSWLGTFRNPKSEECLDGFISKNMD